MSQSTDRKQQKKCAVFWLQPTRTSTVQKGFVASRQLVSVDTKPLLFQCHIKSWSIKPVADCRAISGSPRTDYWSCSSHQISTNVPIVMKNKKRCSMIRKYVWNPFLNYLLWQTEKSKKMAFTFRPYDRFYNIQYAPWDKVT